MTQLSSNQLRQAADLQERIEALTREFNAIMSGQPQSASVSSSRQSGLGKRTMSPEAKARIAAGQRARWAQRKDGTPTTSAPRKGTMSAEGRARIVAAQKARWARARGEAVPVTAPAAAPAPGKRTMSAEGRAKIAAAARRRWKKAKAAGRNAL
jgi:hypothetical protein